MIGGFPVHPLANAFPLIDGERFEELCQSIEAHGLIHPIVLHDGVLIDGRNRLRACLASGIEPRFVEYAESLEIPNYIWASNAERNHVTPDQRAMAATAFLEYEEEQARKRRAAGVVNLAQFQDNESEGGEPEEEPVPQVSAEPERTHSETREKIAERANVSRYKAEQAIAVKRYDDEHGTDIGEQVSKGELPLKDAAKHVRGTFGTGQNEWYTPAEYVEKARAVMGGIDLDPASTEAANQVIQAKRIFTQEDDGLAQEWAGRVWLNPPYSKPLIANFCQKLTEEWGSGRIHSAIVLTHNYTDTAWFHTLVSQSSAICFTKGRVRFRSSDGKLAAPTQGQAFLYFGLDLEAFRRGFSDVGFVVVRL